MRRTLVAFVLSLALALPVSTVFAQEAAKSSFTDAQRSELFVLMGQFIKDNPQTLISSVEGFYTKQNEDKAAQQGPIDTIPSGVLDNDLAPSVGPKDAPFSIVYFFDYNCGFCKQVDSDLTRLISEEKNIRFLFKELPILNASSEVAARWALAANKQGKYQAFHSALMNHNGSFDVPALEGIAKTVGLDVTKLKADLQAADITDTLQKNLAAARQLGVRGTPFFLFGKEKVPGAISYSVMRETIAKARDGVVVPQAAKDAAAAAAAAPIPTVSDEGLDPETQLEIDRIKSEAKAIVDQAAKEGGIASPLDTPKASTTQPVKEAAPVTPTAAPAPVVKK